MWSECILHTWEQWNTPLFHWWECIQLRFECWACLPLAIYILFSGSGIRCTILPSLFSKLAGKSRQDRDSERYLHLCHYRKLKFFYSEVSTKSKINNRFVWWHAHNLPTLDVCQNIDTQWNQISKNWWALGKDKCSSKFNSRQDLKQGVTPCLKGPTRQTGKTDG